MEDSDQSEQVKNEELLAKAKKLKRDQEVINFVKKCKKESLDFYKDKFARFNYYDRLYLKGSAAKNNPVGKANLELPLVFQQVEPFVCQMVDTMAGESPYIQYTGREVSDDPAAIQITDYTQYQLDNANFLSSYTSYNRNLAKYGTAVMKVCWETETEDIEDEVMVSNPQIDEMGNPVLDAMGLPVMQEEAVTEVTSEKVFDGIRCYNRSLYDFFVPKSASSVNVQKLDWCIDRSWRSPEDIYKNPNYKNTDKVKDILLKKREDSTSEIQKAFIEDQEKRDEVELNNASRGSEKFQGLVEVLEFWGKYYLADSADTLPQPALITIGIINGEAVVLRDEKNPFKYKFKPFIASNDYTVDGEFYGLGEIDHIKGLVNEVTALRNARLDISNMGLNPMWIADRTCGVNFRELVSTPQKIVFANNIDGFRRLDIGGNTAPSTQEIGQATFDIQNTTEIINPRQDASNMGAAFGGTATGVNFLSARSNLRLLLKARLQEKEFFRPLALMLLKYNREMVTDELFFRVTNDPSNPYTQQVGPETFATDVDYKPSSSPTKLTNDAKKADMGYLLQTLAQIEKTAPGTNNFVALLPDIYKLAGFPHSEKYVNDLPTQVMATPDGQFLDKTGKPVQVIQLDESGNPVPPEAQMQPEMPSDGGMPPEM